MSDNNRMEYPELFRKTNFGKTIPKLECYCQGRSPHPAHPTDLIYKIDRIYGTVRETIFVKKLGLGAIWRGYYLSVNHFRPIREEGNPLGPFVEAISRKEILHKLLGHPSVEEREGEDGK